MDNDLFVISATLVKKNDKEGVKYRDSVILPVQSFKHAEDVSDALRDLGYYTTICKCEIDHRYHKVYIPYHKYARDSESYEPRTC